MSTVHDLVSYHVGRRPNAPAVTSVERGLTATWGEMEKRQAAEIRGHDR